MGQCTVALEVHKCWVVALVECDGRRVHQGDNDREQRDDG